MWIIVALVISSSQFYVWDAVPTSLVFKTEDDCSAAIQKIRLRLDRTVQSNMACIKI